MSEPQSAILGGISRAARYLTFRVSSDTEPELALDALRELHLDDRIVVGIGAALSAFCGVRIPGLRDAPVLHGPGVSAPSTPAALWVWLLGDDRGELLHRGRAVVEQLSGAFDAIDVVEGFVYADSRDLSGYVDGTENPQGEAAAHAAIATGLGAGLDGSSFVAVQQWLHDLDALDEMSSRERDHVIGRRRSDNEEIADAPDSAHVKRTAQESFEPEAFVLRRSMPWADPSGEGLVFVAFGRSFDAFEALLQRMLGLEDGVVDALFRFTTPVSSAYYWCPPRDAGALDLSAFAAPQDM